MSDSVFEKDGQWFFRDDNGTSGPYPTENMAYNRLAMQVEALGPDIPQKPVLEVLCKACADKDSENWVPTLSAGPCHRCRKDTKPYGLWRRKP